MRRWRSFSVNFATLAARLSSTASILIANGVAHRHMTGEQYGLWIMLYSINLFTNGLDLGFQFTLGNRLAALGSRGADGEGERRETFLSIFFLQCLIFLVDSLIVILVVPLIPWARWFKIHDPLLAVEVVHLMPVALIVMISTLPFGLMWTAFFAYQEIKLASALTGVCSVLQTAVFVVAACTCKFTSVILLYFTSNVALGIILTAYLFIRRKWAFSVLPLSRMLAIIRSMARVSFHAFFHGISAIIGTILGPIVSGAVGGLVSAGDFGNMQKLFSFLTTAHLAIMAPLGPTITQDSHSGNWDAVRRRLRICVFQLWPLFFFIVGGVVWAFHPVLIRVWLGYPLRDYRLAGLLLVWACLAGFINTFSVFLNSLGLMKVQAAFSFAMILPSILLPIFMGRWLGLPGIVIGLILCAIPAGVIWPIYTRRALRLHMLRV
jgi:O-antigen/teichoic acid export membrane protein